MGTHADSIVCCLSLISATVKKYWPEPTWSRKKFIWLIGHSALLRETWAGTQDRNLHNHGETLPGGLFSEDCSTCFFFPHNPEPPVQGWHCPQWPESFQAVIDCGNAPPPKLAYRRIWWKYFFRWGFLFPDAPVLCQVNKIYHRTLVHYCGRCCGEQGCKM